jgi:tetratricopeptide (TPR) repeat protein
VKSRFLISVACVFISFLGASSPRAESDEAVERNNQGAALLKQGKIDEAIGPLLKAADLNPKDPDARLNLAYAYDRQGRFDDAIVQYQKAIELKPRNSVAHNNLGVLYDKKGLYDEAIREFEAVLKLDPKSATGPKNLETAKKNQSLIQDHEKQIAEALKNAEAQPENSNASYKLARLYAAYGKKDQAIGWLEKALKLGFNDIGYLKVDSALDSLRNEPDYVWLMKGR